MKGSRKSKPDLENMARNFIRQIKLIFTFKQSVLFMPLPFTEKSQILVNALYLFTAASCEQYDRRT